MVSVGNEGSSDSDTTNTKRKSENSGVSPKVKLNTLLQKDILHAAGLSAKKDFLSKMLEKSDRIKDLTTFNAKDIETPKKKINSLPLKGILKKSFSKESDDEFSNDSETNHNNGAVFTPKFASTQIEEATSTSQRNKNNSDYETNTNIKEAFKKQLKIIASKSNNYSEEKTNMLERQKGSILNDKNSDSDCENTTESNKYRNDNMVSKSSLTSTIKLKSINKKSSTSDSDSDSEEDSYKRDFPDIGSVDRFRAIRGKKREIADNIDSKSSLKQKTDSINMKEYLLKLNPNIRSKTDLDTSSEKYSSKNIIHTKKHNYKSRDKSLSSNTSDGDEITNHSRNREEKKQSSHSNPKSNKKNSHIQTSKNYIETVIQKKKRSIAKKNDSSSDSESQRDNYKNVNINHSEAKSLLSKMLSNKNENSKKNYVHSDYDEPKQVGKAKIKGKIDQQKHLKQILKKNTIESSSSDSNTNNKGISQSSSIFNSLKFKQDKGLGKLNLKATFSKKECTSSESEGGESDKRKSVPKNTKSKDCNAKKSKLASSSSESEENELEIRKHVPSKNAKSNELNGKKSKKASVSSESEESEQETNLTEDNRSCFSKAKSKFEKLFIFSGKSLNKKVPTNQNKSLNSDDSSSEGKDRKKSLLIKKSKNTALNSKHGDSSDSDDNLYLQNLFSKENYKDEGRHSKSISKLKPCGQNKLDIESDLSDTSNTEVKKSKSKLRNSFELSRLKNDDSDYNTKNSSGVKRKNRSLPEIEIKNKRAKICESSSESEAHNELNRRKSKLKIKARTAAEKLLLQFETERDDLKEINVTDLDYGFPSKSSDYELFIAKIPKDLRSYLSEAKISLTAATKININEGKLVCVPSEVTEDKNELNFFSQENGELSIITTKLCGKLTGYQEQESLLEMEISENKKNCVALPNIMKQRHPLFGPNYTDKIELNEDIKSKLETSAMPIKIKSKKHKKDKQKDLQSYEQNELIFQMLGKSQEQMSDTHHKSSKKSKEVTKNMDILEYLNKNVFNSEREKMKKKSKEKMLEISINNDYFDTDNVEEKKRKRKRNRENEYENDSEFDSSDTIKSHKRIKISMSSEEEPTDGRASFKLKHNKNRKI